MEDEPEESLPQSLYVSSMDGNSEMDTSVPNTVSNVCGNIKINIHRPLPVIPPRNNNRTRKEDISQDIVTQYESDLDTLYESVIDPSQPLPPGTYPNWLKLKPALQGVKLKKMPKVQKGSEDTNFCVLM